MSARRCPNCGGLVGATAEWCGQCFTRLTVDEPPTATSEAPPEEGVPPPARPEAEPMPDGMPRPEATPGVTGGTPSPPAEPGQAPPAGPEPPPPAGPTTAARPIGGGDGEATARRTTGISGVPGIRSTPDGIVWDCPTCDEVNPIEAGTCPVCGTAFGKLLEDRESRPQVDPGRAAVISLVFPGAGHYVVGRAAEGIARGIVFSFALATGLLSLFAGLDAGSAIFLIVMVVSLGAAGALYVLSTLDAGRAAQDVPPIISTRMLLYGAVGLMLLTLILLTIAAFQNAPRAG
ncbi:MAG: hypothetical protein M3135_03445 [Actinomycetota bacterium]|nr:hypothetical protein [Actinomycetota bacterium]